MEITPEFIHNIYSEFSSTQDTLILMEKNINNAQIVVIICKSYIHVIEYSINILIVNEMKNFYCTLDRWVYTISNSSTVETHYIAIKHILEKALGYIWKLQKNEIYIVDKSLLKDGIKNTTNYRKLRLDMTSLCGDEHNLCWVCFEPVLDFEKYSSCIHPLHLTCLFLNLNYCMKNGSIDTFRCGVCRSPFNGIINFIKNN
jgi:hypothetical protein